MSEHEPMESGYRASQAQNIEVEKEIQPSDYDLKLEETEDGKIAVVRGIFRGREVIVKRFLGIGERETYTAQVDGADELKGHTAEALFERYYSLAKK